MRRRKDDHGTGARDPPGGERLAQAALHVCVLTRTPVLERKLDKRYALARTTHPILKGDVSADQR
jgi:hypothetical protein